jgi:uncharacterized protein related to proFAR isomerase
MDFIPLIKIKKRKIVNSNNNEIKNVKTLLNKYKDNPIYILDYDGIKRDKPNLCILQKLSKKYKLWIDQGPRSLGDIVDSIIAGTENITIRLDLIEYDDLINISDLIENEIYLNIDDSNIYDLNSLYNISLDGYTMFINEKNLDNFKIIDYIKNFAKKNSSYIYIKNKSEFDILHDHNFKGFIVDIEKIEELKIGFRS